MNSIRKFSKTIMVDMNQVSENIFVGSISCLYRGHINRLKKSNISHIISLTTHNEAPDMTVHQFKHLRISIIDKKGENIMKYFEQCNEFINEAVEQGNKVLVHCIAGRSRSVTIAAAYILRKKLEDAYSEYHNTNIFQRMIHKLSDPPYLMVLKAIKSTEDSKALVTKTILSIKKARSVAGPNDSFYEQLVVYLMSRCDLSSHTPLYSKWLVENGYSKTIQSIQPSEKPSNGIQTQMQNVSYENRLNSNISVIVKTFVSCFLILVIASMYFKQRGF